MMKERGGSNMLSGLEKKVKTLHLYGVMREIIAAITIILVGFSVACVSAPPRFPGEEIRLYEWVGLDEKGAKNEALGHLSFSDNSLTPTAQRGQCSLCLEGECIIDDQKITVLSEEFGTVVMGYELSSEKLTLFYSEKSAVLVKK